MGDASGMPRITRVHSRLTRRRKRRRRRTRYYSLFLHLSILFFLTTVSRSTAHRDDEKRRRASTAATNPPEGVSPPTLPSTVNRVFNYNKTIAHKMEKVLEKEFADDDADEEKYHKEKEEELLKLEREHGGIREGSESVMKKVRIRGEQHRHQAAMNESDVISNTSGANVAQRARRKQKMKALISRTEDILVRIDEALSRERENRGGDEEGETLVDSEGNEYVLERTEKRKQTSMQTDSNLMRDIVCVFVLSVVVSLLFSIVVTGGNKNKRMFQSAPSSDFVGFFACGALVGPFGLRLVDEPVQLETLGEFGVIALCFSVGQLCDASVFEKIGSGGRKSSRRFFSFARRSRSSSIVMANVAMSSFIGALLGVATKIGILKGVVIGAISVFDGSNSLVVVGKSSTLASSANSLDSDGGSTDSLAGGSSGNISSLTSPQDSKRTNDELNESNIMRWWTGIAFAIVRNWNTTISFSQSMRNILYALVMSSFVTFAIALRFSGSNKLVYAGVKKKGNVNTTTHANQQYETEKKLISMCAMCLFFARLTEMFDLGYELGAFAFGIACHHNRKAEESLDCNTEDDSKKNHENISDEYDDLESQHKGKKTPNHMKALGSDLLRAAHALAFTAIGMNVRMNYLREKMIPLTLSSIVFIVLVRKLRTLLRKGEMGLVKHSVASPFASYTLGETTGERKDIKSYSDVITLLLLKRSLFADGISLNAYHFAFHTQVLCIFCIWPLMDYFIWRRSRMHHRRIKSKKRNFS